MKEKILAHKVLSDSTLKGWTKAELIEQIRILEYNWKNAEQTLDTQAQNCEKLLKEEQKKSRYKIKQDYFGLFDEVNILCTTDSLFHAVMLCEMLEKAVEDRPYSHDFVKVAKDVDDVLDYYPGDTFADAGHVYDVKNWEEFKRLKEEYDKQKLKKH